MRDTERERAARYAAGAIRALADLRPPVSATPPMFDETKIKCICGKWKDLRDMEIVDTGVIHAISNVCRGCRSAVRHDRGLARVICVTCKRVVMRLVPHVDQVGFRYEANRSYHVDSCGFCTPGLKVSYVIEKLLHDRRMGRGPLRADGG